MCACVEAQNLHNDHLFSPPHHLIRRPSLAYPLPHLPQQLGHLGSDAILGVRSSFDHLPPTLTKLDFGKWLSSNHLHMTTHDLDTAFNYFSEEGSDGMSVAGFVGGMRGDLNGRRMAIVEKAFGSIAGGSDSVGTDVVMSSFNVEMMPEVRKGTLTVDDARIEFLRRLEGHSEVETEGAISRADFVEYYSWLGCSIISDDTFVDLVETVWNVKEGDYDEERVELCCRIMKAYCTGKVKGVSDPVKQKALMRTSLQHYDLENKGSLFLPQFMQSAHLMR